MKQITYTLFTLLAILCGIQNPLPLQAAQDPYAESPLIQGVKTIAAAGAAYMDSKISEAKQAVSYQPSSSGLEARHTTEYHPVKEGKKIDYNSFKSLVDEMWPHVETSRGKQVNLFLGATGEGKSTTISWLLGEHMIEKKEKMTGASNNPFSKNTYKTFIDREENYPSKNSPHIGHSEESCTLWPSCHNTPLLQDGPSYQLTLCDCPGFFDNRGTEEECCAALGTKAMVNNSNGIQSIVFVISRPSLEAGRGKLFSEVIQALHRVFDRPEEHVASIFFAFTKANGWTVNEFGNEVYEYKKFIGEKLGIGNKMEKVKQVIKNLREGEDEADLGFEESARIYSFLNKMITEHTENFFVAYPTQSEDHIEILAKLQDSQPIDKSNFRFMGGENAYTKTSEFYQEIATDGNYLLDAKDNIPVEIKECKENIARLEKETENAKAEHEEMKKTADSDKKRRELKVKNNKVIKLCNKNIEDIKEQVEIIEKEIEKKEREIERYDTNDMVPGSTRFYSGSDMRERSWYSESCGFLWLSSNQHYYYELDVSLNIGMPYAEVKEEFYGGTLTPKRKDYNEGIYNAYYRTNYNRSSSGLSIKFSVEKRHKYQDMIKRLDKQIKSKEEKLKQEKQEIKKKKEEIYNRELENIELDAPSFEANNAEKVLLSITERIDRKKEETRATRLQLEEKEAVLKGALAGLESRRAIFKLLLHTYTLVGFNDQDHGSVTSFIKRYEQYTSNEKDESKEENTFFSN